VADIAARRVLVPSNQAQTAYNWFSDSALHRLSATFANEQLHPVVIPPERAQPVEAPSPVDSGNQRAVDARSKMPRPSRMDAGLGQRS